LITPFLNQTMRLPKSIPATVLTIATAGFVATVAQIIVLREVLVLFYGNELSMGLIFSGWLLWSGLGSAISGKWAARASLRISTLGLLIVFMAALLPLTVILIRASRIIWSLPAGELPTIGKMLIISLASTGLFCPFSGALFGVCWAYHRQKDPTVQPLVIYLGEAGGSATGGIVFYFLFIPFFSPLTSVWITSGLALAMAAGLLRPWRLLSKAILTWIVVTLCIAVGVFSLNGLRQKSRRWQWGGNLAAIYDTAYHNIAILKKEGQVSIFTNGLWNFSEPDRLSAEYAVHLALLQHPNPETILVLGGGIAGLMEEMFKHPSVQYVGYVEPDPDFIPFIYPFLLTETQKSLQSPRVNVFHVDPRSFLRRSNKTYDIVLMNMGDPITAQMNRFYTREFFEQVNRRLSDGGVFTFAVSGGESMLGPAQARFLSAIKKTLTEIFPNTLIYPGDRTRFFATDENGTLHADYMMLTDRIYHRDLQLAFITESLLQDALSPFRLDYLKSILAEIPVPFINRDFYPICYFHNLMMWAAQWHPFLQKLFQFLSNVKLFWIWMAITIVGIIIVGFFWIRPSKYKLAVAGTILVSGTVEMVIQVVLLLVFQIVEGFVYRQLSLIIAFFMTGLAVGSGFVSWKRPLQSDPIASRGLFIRVQTVMCLLPFSLAVLLPLIMKHAHMISIFTPATIGGLFCCLSLAIGFVGGVHFGLAVIVIAGTGIPSEKIGGVFYALDLAGAAAGALLASCFIIPIYGIENTLILMGTSAGISLLTILRNHNIYF
jgi:spermidine synthase